MDQSAKKIAVAQAALDYIEEKSVIGVGTGSTVNCFIDELVRSGISIEAAVSSSITSTERLESHGIKVVDLNDAPKFDVYVDGADESNPDLQLIKGGGGALTREKIVAEAAEHFICIVDDSKLVETLGKFPLPIEVIPMAIRQITQALSIFDADIHLREGFVTDNGNVILDVHGLHIDKPLKLERELNQLPGVVTVGLFARRPADLLIIGSDKGVEIIESADVATD